MTDQRRFARFNRLTAWATPRAFDARHAIVAWALPTRLKEVAEQQPRRSVGTTDFTDGTDKKLIRQTPKRVL